MTDPELTHRDRCAIAGIGVTDYSKDSGRSELTLATQATLAALEDAGLTPADVDGVVHCDYDLVLPFDLSEALGLELTYWSSVAVGGVSPAGMVGQAVAAILSGQATTVVVYRSINGRSGRRMGAGWGTMNNPRVGGKQTWDEFYLPYGILSPGQFFGLVAQRHMTRYGTTREQLGHIALVSRERANANPQAQMYERKLTMEDYLAAPALSEPLHLFDFCLETDGANAVVVTTAERARDLRRPPALIRAVAQATVRGGQGGKMWPVLTRDDITMMSSRRLAPILYGRAGLGPSDIDVAQIYDCFTITALLQLEDYGFCEVGEGGPFAASGALDLHGSIPMNTSGGHLSEAYIHGMNHVVEGVRQVRGESTSQVPGAETVLVTSGPPIATTGLILRKDA
ncbi:MAG: lipid-transfer protein [Acidimicrobiia bacterium]